MSARQGRDQTCSNHGGCQRQQTKGVLSLAATGDPTGPSATNMLVFERKHWVGFLWIQNSAMPRIHQKRRIDDREGNWRGDIVQYFSPQSDSALSYDAPLWYTNIAISEPMPLASNQTCGKSCKVDHACTASISICSGLEKYGANMLHSVLVKQRSFDGVLIWLGIRYLLHQFTPCNSVRFYTIHRGASFF